MQYIKVIGRWSTLLLDYGFYHEHIIEEVWELIRLKIRDSQIMLMLPQNQSDSVIESVIFTGLLLVNYLGLILMI